MAKTQLGAGRGKRLDPLSSCSGSLQVELAASFVALALFFMMLMPLFGVVAGHVALTSLARDAARAAAMEVDRTSAERAMQRVLRNASGVHHGLTSDGAFVRVRLHRDVHFLRFPTTFEIVAEASALEEVPW